MQTHKMRMRDFVLFFVMFLFSTSLYAQQKTITGTVTDSNGDPIVGASVLVKGTTQGAVTNIDGKYTLNVSGDAKVLIFRSIGMASKEIAVSGNTMNVSLSDDQKTLDEVVVIGYGTLKRKDLTGSVSSVSSETLAAVPVSSPTEALTGKLAGVQITTTEGSPDAEMKIRVRGGGSITQSNDPLFIVDGFPVSSINDIPPTDIESIDVLKDASSTAIYGSRGANGVVIVTTKSGKSGKIKVSYNAYYSTKKIAKTLDVLSPYDYAKWQYELALLKDDVSSYNQFFGNYQDMDLFQNIPSNDWQNLTFGRIGTTFNQSLNVSGGTDLLNYSFNYSHIADKAIMEQSNFKRDNLSLKLNSKLNKKLSLDFSARYSNTNINGGGTNDVNSTYDSDKRLKYSVIYTPIPLADLNSSSGSSNDDIGNLYNPLQSINDNARERNRKALNLAGSATWEAIHNLRLRTEVGLDDKSERDQRYWGVSTYYVNNVPAAANQGMPAISLENSTDYTIRNTNTANYDFKKILDESNHLNLMLGQEYIITKSRTLTDIVHGFPETFSADDAWKLSSQGVPFSVDNYYEPDDKLFSFFGRANYDYLSKYLLSLTFRADASSRFSDENRWGYFPSAAAAWRISSEPFMAGAKKWLDDLKLRASYGTAGNNNIPKGQLTQSYASSSTSWINGYLNYWAPSKIMSNPDLKWETTITRNVGLDFTAFNSRLTTTIEGYINSTKDLLIKFPVQGTGYDYQYRNMGETQNKGFEVTVNWVAINTKNYGLTLNANIGFNKTKIVSLGLMDDFGAYTYWASSEIGNDFWIAKGGAVGQMLGYRSDGRYEVSDFEGYDAKTKKWTLKSGVADASAVVGDIRPGSMKLKNIDGSEDNLVTVADREIIGDANPINTGGFNINGRVYNFDIAAAFNWNYGNDIYNANKIEFTQTGKYQYRNMISKMADGNRWTNLKADGTISNDPDELVAMNANTTMWSPYTARMVFSDWAVEDGSFLRLSTLTVGYTLPSSLLKSVKIHSLRFYVTGYNVFCLTNYSGYDPEVSTIRSTNLTPGVDYSAYPKSRQLVFGLNLNF